MTPLSTRRSQSRPASAPGSPPPGRGRRCRGTGARPPVRPTTGCGTRAGRRTAPAAARRAGGLDLVIDRAGLVGGHEAVGEPLELAVEHQSAPELEDVGRGADQPRGLEHAPLPAARVDDDLGAGSGARLQRSHPQQAEAAVGAGQQRGVGTQQSPVQIDVQAPHGGGDRSTAAPRRGRRWRARRRCRPRRSAVRPRSERPENRPGAAAILRVNHGDHARDRALGRPAGDRARR